MPGQTTEAEVKEILQEKSVYATCEIWGHESEWDEWGIDCGSRIFIDFRRGDNVVQGVGFEPYSFITVQEVVAKYGEPKGVLVGALGVHVIDA